MDAKVVPCLLCTGEWWGRYHNSDKQKIPPHYPPKGRGPFNLHGPPMQSSGHKEKDCVR